MINAPGTKTFSGAFYGGTMNAEQYLKYLVEEIHTAVVATVDGEGLPVTAAIDMMDFDENGLYFLTAKGKSFYDRLTKRGYMALTAVKGADTMTSVAVSVRGKVKEIGASYLPRLFEKNPYMCDIYPTEESRRALTVFKLYEGNGEWFDLSKKAIERAFFSFGGSEAKTDGYFITDACIGCESCAAVCPQNCINAESIPYVIEQEHCLHCGNCMEACPVGAVKRR